MTRQGYIRTLVALLACAAVLAPAWAQAGSTKISKNHCVTSGGGRFVDIPEFPGERIDRRLLADIEYLRKRFKIYIADGYSVDKSHTIRGEHPIGLALDILPDRSIGGDWGDINRLARWAEPRQDRVRVPFRWVGYWGDKRHGPRNHLHLSWEHSPTKPKHVARTVETIRCPGS
jgi:hypothetical protein